MEMIIQGDCLDEMRKMESDSISAIVCDPPYALGFMGKKWDSSLPSVEIWKEALRVSKPGTWLLAFGGTRTYHRLTCAIEDAGWEIRDCIMWIYGSGFPKGKGCLKPAYEPIIIARKPGCKVSDNFLNIDECRIGNGQDKTHSGYGHDLKTIYEGGLKWNGTDYTKGRWPANVILDEEAGDMLDEQTGILKSQALKPYKRNSNDQYHGNFPDNNLTYESSSGGASRFFYCAKASSRERNEGLDDLPLKDAGIKNDSGRGFSESDPMKVIQYKNPHPCIKPLKLMEYLIKLVMPKRCTTVRNVLLDPFAGSGTTILAAKKLGFEAIGIELNEEYCEIARKRIESIPNG